MSSWNPVPYIKKHKRTIILGGAATIVVGGSVGYGYYKYSQHIAENEEQKRVMSQRMRYLYEENRKTVDMALRSLLPKIEEKLKSHMDVEALFAELKNSAVSREDKKNIWESIKLQSFTRSITAVYSVSLLHLFLSVQVNIIGRHLFMKHQYEKQKNREEETKSWWSYLSSFSNKTSVERVLTAEEILHLPEAVQQTFLCFVSHFENHGLDRLIQIVDKTVKNHISDLSLKQLFTPNDMFHLIEAMRTEIEPQFEYGSGENQLSISSLMLEAEDASFNYFNVSESEMKVLKVLTDELRDILDSEDYVNVFREASSGAFAILHKHLEETMQTQHQKQQMRKSQLSESQQQEAQSEYPVEENVVRIHMANVVSRLTTELKTILDGSEENEYVWTVHENLMLNKYCVIVYSNGFFI